MKEKKHTIKSDQDAPKESELQHEENLNKDRRKVIKTSIQLAAAAYVAPATLELLTATRATAQSAIAAAKKPVGGPFGGP